MNEICRIGEPGSINAIKVKLGALYGAWTCAFVKWLLSTEPRVRTLTGQTIIDSGRSSVTLTITPTCSIRQSPCEFTKSLNVLKIQEVVNLREMILCRDQYDKRQAWQGLVDVKTWFRYQFNLLFRQFPPAQEQPILKRAIGQVLFFIVVHLPDRLILCDDFSDFWSKLTIDYTNQTSILERLLHVSRPKVFLDSEVRLAVASELVEDQVELIKGDPHLVTTLSEGNLASMLDVHNLSGGDTFLVAVGEIGTVLLTLSLFGPDIDNYPRLQARKDRINFRLPGQMKYNGEYINQYASWKIDWLELIAGGWQRLLDGRCSSLVCPTRAIFKYVAQILGHQRVFDCTVISAKMGQVLYPAFFEADDFIVAGYMQLCSFPGGLISNKMTFDSFLDAYGGQDMAGFRSWPLFINRNDIMFAPLGDRVHMSPYVSETFFAQRRASSAVSNSMVWKISVESEHFKGELNLTKSQARISAWSLIERLGFCSLTPTCKHGELFKAGHLGESVSFMYIPSTPR